MYSLILSLLAELFILLVNFSFMIIAYAAMYFFVFPKVKFLKFLFEEPKDKKRNKPKNRKWKH